MAADPLEAAVRDLGRVLGEAVGRLGDTLRALGQTLLPLAKPAVPAAVPAAVPPVVPAAAAPTATVPAAAAPTAVVPPAAAVPTATRPGAGGTSDFLRVIGDILGSGIGRLIAAVQGLARSAAPSSAGPATAGATAGGFGSLQGPLAQLVANSATALGHLSVISIAVTGTHALLRQAGRPPTPPGTFGGGGAALAGGGVGIATTGPAPATPPAGGAPAGGVSGLMAGLGGVVLAFQAAVSAVEAAVSAVKGFVEALNPGLILNFDRALEDLKATVGVAFQPIFEILTGTFREVAGIILPLMQQLQPVVGALAQTFASDLLPVVKLVVDVVEALVPVFQVIAVVVEAFDSAMRPVVEVVRLVAVALGGMLDLLLTALQPVLSVLALFSGIMDGISEVLDVVVVIFRALTDTITAFIASLFGVNISDALQAVADVAHKVVEYLLIFIATLAKFFGADTFLKNLIAGLQPKTGEQAAGPTSIKSFEGIGKDLALASAQAAGGEGGKPKADLSDVIKELEDIQKGTNTSGLIQRLDNILKVLEAIAHPGDTLRKAGRGFAHGFFHPIDTARELLS